MEAFFFFAFYPSNHLLLVYRLPFFFIVLALSDLWITELESSSIDTSEIVAGTVESRSHTIVINDIAVVTRGHFSKNNSFNRKNKVEFRKEMVG